MRARIACFLPLRGALQYLLQTERLSAEQSKWVLALFQSASIDVDFMEPFKRLQLDPTPFWPALRKEYNISFNSELRKIMRDEIGNLMREIHPDNAFYRQWVIESVGDATLVDYKNMRLSHPDEEARAKREHEILSLIVDVAVPPDLSGPTSLPLIGRFYMMLACVMDKGISESFSDHSDVIFKTSYGMNFGEDPDNLGQMQIYNREDLKSADGDTVTLLNLIEAYRMLEPNTFVFDVLTRADPGLIILFPLREPFNYHHKQDDIRKCIAYETGAVYGLRYRLVFEEDGRPPLFVTIPFVSMFHRR